MKKHSDTSTVEKEIINELKVRFNSLSNQISTWNEDDLAVICRQLQDDTLETNPQFGFVLSELLRGKWLSNQGHCAQSHKCFESFEKECHEIGELSISATYHIYKGYNLNSMGLYQKSYSEYVAAYKYALENGSIRSQSTALDGIASNLKSLGNVEKAIEYFHRSLNLTLELDDKAEIAASYNNIANAYQVNGDYTKAIYYYKQSLVLKEELGNQERIASTLNNLGNTHFYLEEFDIAHQYFNRALEIKERIGNDVFTSSTLLGIASILRKQQRYEEALSVCHRLIAIAEKADIQYNRMLAILQTSETLYDLSNFKEAYDYMREYHQWYVKNSEVEFTKNFNEMAIVFDVERNQRIIAEQQLELDRKSHELTTNALSLAQKNQLLTKLHNLINDARNENMSSDDILDLIESKNLFMLQHSNWSAFEQQFSAVNQSFTQNLSSKYPDLSPTELRLCMLLRMNLRTKEIADILCLSSKSVEVYRFRLRKKLHLEKNTNLVSYLSSH